jgi:hypothetical protein
MYFEYFHPSTISALLKKNTFGTFDGFILDIKKILDKVINSTEKDKYESLVLTFSTSSWFYKKTRDKVIKHHH